MPLSFLTSFLQVASSPFSSSTSFKVIAIVRDSSAVAVTLSFAFVVPAVYSVTLEENVGERANDPIVSPERVGVKGLQYRKRS